MTYCVNQNHSSTGPPAVIPRRTVHLLYTPFIIIKNIYDDQLIVGYLCVTSTG